ncbi:MAG TPA: hypothetical protein VEO02_05670 [Thermoanaerobaculia bacterium]|nr:hypothetical protein [Thermoanaerobaculia bacterium]
MKLPAALLLLSLLAAFRATLIAASHPGHGLLCGRDGKGGVLSPLRLLLHAQLRGR